MSDKATIDLDHEFNQLNVGELVVSYTPREQRYKGRIIKKPDETAGEADFGPHGDYTVLEVWERDSHKSVHSATPVVTVEAIDASMDPYNYPVSEVAWTPLAITAIGGHEVTSLLEEGLFYKSQYVRTPPERIQAIINCSPAVAERVVQLATGVHDDDLYGDEYPDAQRVTNVPCSHCEQEVREDHAIEGDGGAPYCSVSCLNATYVR